MLLFLQQPGQKGLDLVSLAQDYQNTIAKSEESKQDAVKSTEDACEKRHSEYQKQVRDQQNQLKATRKAADEKDREISALTAGLKKLTRRRNRLALRYKLSVAITQFCNVSLDHRHKPAVA